MTDFMFNNGGVLTLAFRGSDLVIKATVTHEDGHKKSSSTFLYGSGKNSPSHSSILENDFFAVCAPFARGDIRPGKPEKYCIEGLKISFNTPRDGDSISLSGKDDMLILTLDGQDFGEKEKLTIQSPVTHDDTSQDPTTNQLVSELCKVLVTYGIPEFL